MTASFDESFGNPSSLHAAGIAAARAIERARRAIRAVVGERFRGLAFTSGGTEANNLAVWGLGRPRRGRRIVTTTVDHPSILEAVEAAAAAGAEVDRVGVGSFGVVDVGRLATAAAGAALVAVHAVHNELGTIVDVAALAEMLARGSPETIIHVDAVGALGRLDLPTALAGASSVSVSAHKAYGPKGVGALGFADGLHPRRMLHGGDQEGGVRPGTQNVEGIVGFGEAAKLVRLERSAIAARLDALDDALLEGLASLAPALGPLVPRALRVPGLVPLALRGMPSEVFLHRLEAHGVYCSAGAACHARRPRSPVLDAIGAPADVGLIRVSMGRTTTPDDVAAFLDAAAAALREGAG